MMQTSSPTNPDHFPLAEWLAIRATRLGLTNYRTAEQVWSDGMMPAIALSALLGHSPVGPWAEFGPGSGALGLTVALTSPAAAVDLVDRRARVTSFLDLTVRHFAMPNARPLTLNLSRAAAPTWAGVCIRAFATPRDALTLASRHARVFVCAWHGPTLHEYDQPPSGFALVSRVETTCAGLSATLYRRLGA